MSRRHPGSNLTGMRGHLKSDVTTNILASNHGRLDCLFNRLFRLSGKKTSKPALLALLDRNPPVTGGFLSQRASKAEIVCIWYCHIVKHISPALANRRYIEQRCLITWHPVSQLDECTRQDTGPLFTKKTPSYGYRDPHDKPKTVWRLSQVYNGNPYTDKTASS